MYRKVPKSLNVLKTIILTLLLFSVVSCAPVTESDTDTKNMKVAEIKRGTGVEKDTSERNKDSTSEVPMDDENIQNEHHAENCEQLDTRISENRN